MRRPHLYKITVEDETRLERLKELRFSRTGLTVRALTLFLLCFLLSWLIIAVTPLRKTLPGYLPEAERESTIENVMRLDSLHDAYTRDKAYLDNITTILDTEREPDDSVRLAANPRPMTADSLLRPSKAELRFRSEMEEREKYNLSVLAPLAADGMLFTNVSEECTITADSADSPRAEIILAGGNPVCAIAESTVADCYFSPSEGGYVVLLQHPRGFLSRYARLGTPLIEPGDHLDPGQILALQDRSSGRKSHLITLEMWHNGDKLIPAAYIGH